MSPKQQKTPANSVGRLDENERGQYVTHSGSRDAPQPQTVAQTPSYVHIANQRPHNHPAHGLVSTPPGGLDENERGQYVTHSGSRDAPQPQTVTQTPSYVHIANQRDS
jgi:hypothetical protein